MTVKTIFQMIVDIKSSTLVVVPHQKKTQNSQDPKKEEKSSNEAISRLKVKKSLWTLIITKNTKERSSYKGNKKC